MRIKLVLLLIILLFAQSWIISQPVQGHPPGSPAPFPFIGLLAFIGSVLGVRNLNRPKGKA